MAAARTIARTTARGCSVRPRGSLHRFAVAKDEGLRRQTRKAWHGWVPTSPPPAKDAGVAALQRRSLRLLPGCEPHTAVLYATPWPVPTSVTKERPSPRGVLFRGFNDLRWLPEVPADDSGRPGAA